jgi:FixJ family two-component response regulator
MVAPTAVVQHVIFVDDNDDLREAMIELVQGEDRECVAFASLEELQRGFERVRDATLAILDVNLGDGARDGVDAYQWLRAKGFRGRVVFLTGHARTDPRVARASAAGDARVLEKPIASDKLLELIEESAGARDATG